MARARRIIYDSDDSEDDFPSLESILAKKPLTTRPSATASEKQDAGASRSFRRVKLGETTDNSLLKPWSEDTKPRREPSKAKTVPQPRVEFRTRRTLKKASPVKAEASDEESSVDEVTITEDVTFHDDSDFIATSSEDEVEDEKDDLNDPFEDFQHRPAAKPRKASGTVTEISEKTAKPRSSQESDTKGKDQTTSKPPPQARPKSRILSGVPKLKQVTAKDDLLAEFDTSGEYFSAEEDLDRPFSKLKL